MTKAEWFSQLGEPFAAGLFEFPEASPMVRYANALKRYWQEAELPGYDGGRLYPCGVSSYMYDTSICVRPHYANTLQINRGGLRKKDPQALSLALEEYNRVIGFADSPHTVGGMGWTHSFPNYARVLSEGLEQYRERILALPEGDFREAMLTVMEAVDIYHNRCLQILRRDGAPEALIGMLLNKKHIGCPRKGVADVPICRIIELMRKSSKTHVRYPRDNQLIFTRNTEILLPEDAPVYIISTEL